MLNDEQTKQIEVSDKDLGLRIDSFLNGKFSDYSRSYFQHLIEEGTVLVNQKQVKPSYKLKESDIVEISFKEQPETSRELLGEKIPLDILYEDDDVIVLNKQPGLVVHPAAGNKTGTLVNALIEHFPEIKKAVHDETNLVSKNRPGLVQRLDKDTSGVMVVAKNPRALHSLSRQIQNRKIKKVYWCLCLGWPKSEEGRIVSYLGRQLKDRKKMAEIGKERGKEAISDYKVLKYLSDTNKNRFALIEFDIKTGRTHQIRVQAKQMGHPILGDLTYGSRESIGISGQLGISRQLLHAKQLQICLPGSPKLTTFEAPLPKDFQNTLQSLREL